VDRTRALRFRFDGRSYVGLPGDTLASALLAHGVHLLGRSFKYHRPRGVLAAGAEEPNALITVTRDAARETPNLRATQIELYDGLNAHSQNRWPSLAFDVGALNDLLSPLFPSGFYYKTFMWPRHAWHRLYEPLIRAAAGLGRAPAQADPDRYANRFAHCDVLIVGAGPSGIAAALAAADTGARVMICDEQAQLGGSLLDEPADAHAALIEGMPASAWLEQSLRILRQQPRVQVLPRTTAFGYFAHNMLALNERLTDHLAAPGPDAPRERTWQVRAREVVLCTGAIERPLVFPGNDRPGVMLAAAARTYLNRYGVIAGRRAVVIAGCDSAYQAALDLQRAGVSIELIADVRGEGISLMSERARSAGIQVQTQSTVLGTEGRLRLRAVQLARLDADRQPLGRPTRIGCDLLLMSGGWTPSVHLHSQARGQLSWNEPLQAFIPGRPVEKLRSAGASRGVLTDIGVLSYASAIHDGRSAGLLAARAAGMNVEPCLEPPPLVPPSSPWVAPGALAQPPSSKRGKAFVDWQNDVTASDLALATREGFASIEHIKRYTTTGMATDQGKTSNLNALGYVAQRLDRPLQDVGLTSFRMPYTPVSFGSLAGYGRGDLFDPIRTTPVHEWAARAGAVFEDVGLWKRARYFPRPGEDMRAAVERECRAVRNACGLFDASTLGKIELVGRDAVTFMNRLYANAWDSLPVGRCRYGVLLRDDGFVIDDGVVARVGAERFHVTTTTGGAPRVLAMMEDYLQTEWSELQVWLTSTTEQWAVIAVQGPLARGVLQPLVEDLDLSASSLPHMSVARGHICGVPLLLFRVSFTGELGFELNVPADRGLAVWEAIRAAGAAAGLTPYGTETMHVLRAEKGYIIVGQETDGTVTADDVGLGWAIGRNKPDFVGKRSLQRAAMSSPDRKQLVGLLTLDPQCVIEEGSQVMASAGQHPRRPLGHVSSSYYSATLGRSIALALVAGGRARLGQTLYVPAGAAEQAVKVASPVFYDPQGARLNG
jgi:sarcosine oxidase subunit alpha